MILDSQFTNARLSARAKALQRLPDIARRYGATELHLLGSLAHCSGDAFSDIDAWLTFPDADIDRAIEHRTQIFGELGDALIRHEMAPVRPLGGVYALVLYDTNAGPVHVDWYLAPQRTSRIPRGAKVVFEDVDVSDGDWILDNQADQTDSLSKRIDWLICMLFIGVKMVARTDNDGFVTFLEGMYR